MSPTYGAYLELEEDGTTPRKDFTLNWNPHLPDRPFSISASLPCFQRFSEDPSSVSGDLKFTLEQAHQIHAWLTARLFTP